MDTLTGAHILQHAPRKSAERVMRSVGSRRSPIAQWTPQEDHYISAHPETIAAYPKMTNAHRHICWILPRSSSSDFVLGKAKGRGRKTAVYVRNTFLKKNSFQVETCEALILLARLQGFEPWTYGLEVRCSIQLSYRRADIYSLRNRDLLFRSTFDTFGQGKTQSVRTEVWKHQRNLSAITTIAGEIVCPSRTAAAKPIWAQSISTRPLPGFCPPSP